MPENNSQRFFDADYIPDELDIGAIHLAHRDFRADSDKEIVREDLDAWGKSPEYIENASPLQVRMAYHSRFSSGMIARNTATAANTWTLIEAPSAGGDGMTDTIPIPWLRLIVPQKKVKGDSSKLAGWLKRKGIHLCKIAGKYHAERADLLRVFRAGTREHEAIKDYENETE